MSVTREPRWVTFLGPKCKTHFIKYGLHYDKEAWENFKKMSMEPKNIGICMHCKQSVKGKRGMKKEDRMWEHIFQEYFEYPYSWCRNNREAHLAHQF